MYALWGTAGSTKKIERTTNARINHGFTFLAQDVYTLELYNRLYPSRFRMAQYMLGEGFPVFKNNEVTYFPMGEDAFDDIFVELEEAKEFIMINFFIVAEGAIWDHLHEILKAKVEEGVKVMFIYDDFGALFRDRKSVV